MAKKWYNKSLKEMRYNPLGMWGSYVGAVLLLLLTIAFSRGMFFYGDINNPPVYIKLIVFPLWILNSLSISTSFITNLIIMTLTGFLIGWGIHSIVRKVRS